MSETNIEHNPYNNIERLSDEKLSEIWSEYLKDKTQKNLRDTLIVQYIYLTRYVVGRIKMNLPPNFAIEDIASYGVEGLIDAVEKYSPNKGARFETYAIMRIRGNIIDKIRAEDWIPRQMRRKIKEVNTTVEFLRQKLGRTPSIDEVAVELNMEKEKVEAILSDTQTVGSIYDKKGTSEDSLSVIDTIEDSKLVDPLTNLEDKDTKKDLQVALKRLPERERLIMVLYYHENLTLKEIGDTLELSESRVCQLHSQAIMKLRNILSSSKSNRLQRSII
ncbi:MAG: FliA/WhiG family RNA polymerase sigma factor [Candidatus Gastranaerophilales bacterium]|nr:FliA/WhiG family RNA polymerase sigma factor [Candidatus Gastranaerophilales bacterium]